MNSKDFILLICILAGTVSMLFFKNVNHHQYIEDLNTDSLTSFSIRSSTTITDTGKNYTLTCNNCLVDTFKNIHWFITGKEVIIRNDGGINSILHKNSKWYLNIKTDAMLAGYLLDSTDDIRAFMSGNNIVDTKNY